MEIKVFKFGGASLKSAGDVRRVARIISEQSGSPLLVVVSAMGKITNALEEVLKFYLARDPLALIEAFGKVYDFHQEMLRTLFPQISHKVYDMTESLFDQLKGTLRKGHLYSDAPLDYNFEYDRIVSFGELLSSCIVAHYLQKRGIECSEADARTLIRTDNHYREARVDWKSTACRIREAFTLNRTAGVPMVTVTQGFIGSAPDGNTTTLGREGSDFSAAIFAYSLKVKEVTIWKDVPGVLNADPTWFRRPRIIGSLSYREAIELAYFGASVIHPRTIKPLENAGIRLYVRDFKKPQRPGTVVENIHHWRIGFPIYIRKTKQVLISISPRDFSFIVEENLEKIFALLSKYRARVNVMQNSAISFSVCTDWNDHTIDPLVEELSASFEVRYNPGVELFTIRHYKAAAIRRVVGNRTLLLEQKTRNTIHLVVR